MPRVFRPRRENNAHEKEHLIAGVRERVNRFGEGRRASRRPSRCKLRGRNRHVRRERRANNLLWVGSSVAHEAGLTARARSAADLRPKRLLRDCRAPRDMRVRYRECSKKRTPLRTKLPTVSVQAPSRATPPSPRARSRCRCDQAPQAPSVRLVDRPKAHEAPPASCAP